MDAGSVRPSATVVITTKNRKDDLRIALRSALTQDAEPAVLVIDDGSTDGTPEMLSREFPVSAFPRLSVHRFEQSGGLIVARNFAARLARTPILISIDDDALFTTPQVVSQTLARFDDPRIGAVGIPFIEINKNPIVRQHATAEGIWVIDMFIGTAHALRRELFLSLGGYRELLFHQHEEIDYSIRMLDAGYVVCLGRGDPIHHLESPRRDASRLDLYDPRNMLLFVWLNVPLPQFLIHYPAAIAVGIRTGFRRKRPGLALKGIWWGLRDSLRYARLRAPVSRQAYAAHRSVRGVAKEISTIDLPQPGPA